MKQFLWGMLAMASLVAAGFFLRYWKITGDRLFVFFALAFAGLSINWIGLSMVSYSFDARHYIFLVRLVAFALIIIGVIDKNRWRSR